MVNLDDIKNTIIIYSILFIIILILLTNNWNLIVILIIILLLIYIINLFIYKKINNSRDKIFCRNSTIDNPMSNILLYSNDRLGFRFISLR